MKTFDTSLFAKWWTEAKSKAQDNTDEIVRYLEENRDRIVESLARIDGEKFFFRASTRWFAFLSRMADAADRLSEKFQGYLMHIPVLGQVIPKVRALKNRLNFKELVEFVQAKLYAMKRLPPYNEKAIAIYEDFIDFCTAHGLDVDLHLPDARRILTEKKKQLLQHKFFQEFTKSRLEQLLAIPFSFDRCVHPVLPDSAFWHRVFEYLEKKKVIDIVLCDRAGNRVSWKHSPIDEIMASDAIRTLHRISAIKARGRRIFFVGHHEGYLSPYFGRSVLRKLGFDNLTKNCNTVVGPRMFSNVVLRNGASNVGNLFLALPSQKTTAVKTSGLAEELRKTARKSQCLIGMPDELLDFIEGMDHETFLSVIAGDAPDRFAEAATGLSSAARQVIEDYIGGQGFAEAMSDLTREDYELFRCVMRECFLLFPEGARSNISPDGTVVMKYVNPKYVQAYFRPGDYVVPINIVGGADIARGWRLSSATLGVSIAEPVEVTREMIDNYEIEGLNIMQTIAGLPNLKPVRCDQLPGTEKVARAR